jgi:hypothetical protein
LWTNFIHSSFWITWCKEKCFREYECLAGHSATKTTTSSNPSNQ